LNEEVARNILYPQKLALTSPTSGGRSVGIVLRGIRTRSLVLLTQIPEDYRLLVDRSACLHDAESYAGGNVGSR
jgi:hypothetical protein